MALIVGPSVVPGGLMSTLLMTQFGRIGNHTVVSKGGTITGTAGFGSSLFLQRITIPAPMAITEIDAGLRLSFNATSNGAGTLSRSFALYSFGNSSSLGSVCSTSGTSSWGTGTVTAGASSSFTQFQDGWALNNVGPGIPIIQPFTFAASSITGGEYVVAQIFDVAQASSSWSFSIFGADAPGASTTIQPSLALVSASAISGTAAVSAFTGSGTVAVLSNAGTLAVNNYELSSNSFVGSAASAIATATAISTKSFSIQSRTIFSAAPSTAGVMSSTALSAGSFITGVTSGSIVTASTDSITFFTSVVPGPRYIGTGSGSTGASGQFVGGLMSTGGMPVSIALTSTAVTYTGIHMLRQPWFALIGS